MYVRSCLFTQYTLYVRNFDVVLITIQQVMIHTYGIAM